MCYQKLRGALRHCATSQVTILPMPPRCCNDRRSIALNLQKKSILFSYSTLRSMTNDHMILDLLLQLQWRQYHPMGCSDISNIGASKLLATSYLQQHINFQVIRLLLSLPIKVVQCLYAPLSFLQRTPHQKRLHLYLGQCCIRFFSNLKHKTIPLSVSKETSAIV
jgi:hypothetical protein